MLLVIKQEEKMKNKVQIVTVTRRPDTIELAFRYDNQYGRFPRQRDDNKPSRERGQRGNWRGIALPTNREIQVSKASGLLWEIIPELRQAKELLNSDIVSAATLIQGIP